jgi:putative transposase
VTFLPAQVQGRWYYLYLILDLYSRKIVGFEVHDTDSAEHAAHLAKRTALAEGVHAKTTRPVLHGDNGATLKATTVLAMLHWLGIKPSYSRPRVSDDNDFVEAVPHREVSAGVPAQRVRRVGHRPAMGGALRALVQRRASAQRHSLCHAGAASCRSRSPRADGSSCVLPAGARTQPATLEWFDPKLDTDNRRHPQSRARHPYPDGNVANFAFQFDRRACFSVPIWQRPSHGAQRRRWEEQSHAQSALAHEHGEDGERRTFSAVSTVAHSPPVGRSMRQPPARQIQQWRIST